MKLHGISPSPSASEDERESDTESSIQMANLYENRGMLYFDIYSI